MKLRWLYTISPANAGLAEVLLPGKNPLTFKEKIGKIYKTFQAASVDSPRFEVLKLHLENLLKNLSWEEIGKFGKGHISLADNCFYIDYLQFIQNKLPDFYYVCEIVPALDRLENNSNTPQEIKKGIQNIFKVMDPRNAHYKIALNCKCELCTWSRNEYYKIKNP